MLDTMAGICGYTEIQCIWSKSGYNEIQSWLNSMNLALDTIRYNVSGPSLDTMDTYLTSRAAASRVAAAAAARTSPTTTTGVRASRRVSWALQARRTLMPLLMARKRTPTTLWAPQQSPCISTERARKIPEIPGGTFD